MYTKNVYIYNTNENESKKWKYLRTLAGTTGYYVVPV